MRPLAFGLFALALPLALGCPPTRSGSGGDDDDSADVTPTSLEDGYYAGYETQITSNPCNIADGAAEVSFDLEQPELGVLRLDWFVDGSAMSCSVFGDEVDCTSASFSVAELEDTTIEGSIAFSGRAVSSTAIDGTAQWVVTCMGAACEEYELPTGMTCDLTFSGVWQQEDVIDPDPDPDPPDDGGDDDDDEGGGEDTPPPVGI